MIISRFLLFQELVLRTNLLVTLNENLSVVTLTELDLYDNQIEVCFNVILIVFIGHRVL